ncbi:hypothetical protein J7J95_02990 [bacterium]|nr:hypothetical protein [bacterium]
MAKFEAKNGNLYIDGKKVLKGWESFSGWYWFGTEIEGKQDSILDSGEVAENDTIWFGFVQGVFEEWGSWSEAELKEQIKKGRVWEIPKANLPYSGRRS